MKTISHTLMSNTGQGYGRSSPHGGVEGDVHLIGRCSGDRDRGHSGETLQLGQRLGTQRTCEIAQLGWGEDAGSEEQRTPNITMTPRWRESRVTKDIWVKNLRWPWPAAGPAGGTGVEAGPAVLV